MAESQSQTTGPGFRPVSVVEAGRRPAPARGRILVVALTAFVVIAAGVSVFIVVGYRPVETGTTFAVGRFAVATAGGRLPRGDVRLRFSKRRGTTFGMSLRNGGRLPIRLKEVTIPGEGTIVQQTGLRLAPEGSTTVAPDETLPFTSLSLDPGAQRFVVVVLRFGKRCPRDGIAVIDAVHVAYSLFGIRKEMNVRLRQRITVPCNRR